MSIKNHIFLDAIASLDWRYESKSVSEYDLEIIISLTIVRCYRIC